MFVTGESGPAPWKRSLQGEDGVGLRFSLLPAVLTRQVFPSVTGALLEPVFLSSWRNAPGLDP